jgi:hypothetical protein
MTSELTLRLSFVGDVALGGPFVERMRPKGAALTYPFEPLRECFSETDVLVLNLEGPLCKNGPPRPGRTALLHNDPAVIDWLRSFPVAVCCLANNHMSDYGDVALLRTRELLAQNNILFVGAGANAPEAGRPLRFTHAGTRVGVLAFTTDEQHVGSVLATGTRPGCCGLPDPETAATQVTDLAAQCDITIVLLHTGYEYFSYPTPDAVALSHRLLAAGATFVVGHHPHVQQGLEVSDGRIICYSLGNFILPEMLATTGRIQYRKPYTKQFAILHAAVSQHGRVSNWSLTGGQCTRNYLLRKYDRKCQQRFNTYIRSISTRHPLSEYARFWHAYSAKRARELQREEVRDVVAKLIAYPIQTLKQLSWSDFKRNGARASHLLRRRQQ